MVENFIFEDYMSNLEGEFLSHLEQEETFLLSYYVPQQHCIVFQHIKPSTER